MSEEFDPYLRWLGIRDPQRPPNHYRLLGVELFESDPDVISNAADRQMAHVRTFQSGRRSPESQKLLNELAGAKVCLLNPQKKAAYDEQLQAERATLAPPPVGPSAQDVPIPALPSGEPVPPAPRFRVKWVALWALSAVVVALAAVLIIEFGVRGAFDQGRELADREGDVTTGVGESSEPPGGIAPDSARDTKTDQPVKPEPGKQPDGAKAAGQQPVKGEAAKKFKPPPPSIGPKAEKPAAKSPPEIKPEPKPPAEKLLSAAESMAAARTAMKQRNVNAARRHLLLAEKAASPQEREQISRLNDVLTPWEEFWAAVRNGILECREGEILRAGGLSVEVVNRSDGVITVRGSADNRKGNTVYPLRKMPAWLALAVAEKKLPENAACLPEAAFLLVDPEGDTRRAMELCEQSARLGAAPSSGLAAELKEALAAAPPPGPEATPAKPPARLPVPDAATQQAEKKKVRDAWRSRFALARNPIDKGTLAADLLREARQSKDTPAGRFALLVEARDLALAAGEPVRFREAIGEIVQAYEVDLLQEQTRALVEASEAPLPSPVRITLAKVTIGLAEDALQADSYDAALQLGKAGFSFASKVMASKGRDPQMIRQASELVEAIPRYKEQHDLALQAEKALAQDPANVKAIEFLGKHYALVKEQWDRGLPLLLKGADAPLKALAEAEQRARRSVTAEEMVKLADQWAGAAPSLEAFHERSARRRALYWYEVALPYLAGTSRERVVRAVDTLKQSETPRRK